MEENMPKTFDDMTMMIQENQLSEMIADQVQSIKDISEKIQVAEKLAKDTKTLSEAAKDKKAGIFFNKGAIESIQDAVAGINKLTEQNTESQKLMFEYMKKLAQITKNLIIIGCSSIAMNRATVRELELKLSGASKEKLSDLAKKEILNIITELKQKEDMMSKQEQLTTEVHTQSNKLNNFDTKLREKDNLDSHQSQQINSLTDMVAQHKNHLKTKDELDEEQSHRLEKLDSFYLKINQNIQEITTHQNKTFFKFQEDYKKQSNEIITLQKNMSDTIDKVTFMESALHSQTKDIASILSELKNNQQSLMQITKHFEDYRNSTQTKIKIFMLTTGIAIACIVVDIIFYIIR